MKTPVNIKAAAIALFAIIILSTANLAANAAKGVPTPPDSFLKTKVYSVSQLIDQISSDPQIRNNYARQFHIAPDKLIAYLKQNIVESYITKTGYYTCYCVRRTAFCIRPRKNSSSVRRSLPCATASRS